MICPVCVTAMVVANMPLITASVGGFVAAKVAYDHNCRKAAERKRFRIVERSTKTEVVGIVKDVRDLYKDP